MKGFALQGMGFMDEIQSDVEGIDIYTSRHAHFLLPEEKGGPLICINFLSSHWFESRRQCKSRAANFCACGKMQRSNFILGASMARYRVSPDLDMHYKVDDFADPWRKPETILLWHGNNESHLA